MKKTKLKAEAPGAEAPKMTPDIIKKWIERDAKAAIAFLDLLVSDPEIMAKLANELFARHIQNKNQVE